MEKTICVFCASRQDVDPIFLETARKTGRLLAQAGMKMLYGGGRVGLMGAVAEGTHEAAGHVIGVIPELLVNKEVAYKEADELIITRDLFERKDIMVKRSDGFLALAGGYGTLDELLEVMTLKQLEIHDSPIYIVNTAGHFDQLLACFDSIIAGGFAPSKRYWRVFDTAEEAVAAMSREA